MFDTLFLLRLEHGNLSRLLGLIEDQAAAAEAGMPMDAELLSLACEYFSDYPDRCHHPKEDLVYKLLSKRDPLSCSGLRDLIAEHRRLHELTEAVSAAVRRMREQPQTAEARVRELLREFTQHYRHHMRNEEEHFFRLAEERLSKDDWDALDFAMFGTIRSSTMLRKGALRPWVSGLRHSLSRVRRGAQYLTLPTACVDSPESRVSTNRCKRRASPSVSSGSQRAVMDSSVTASYCSTCPNARQSERPGVPTATCTALMGRGCGGIRRLILDCKTELPLGTM